VSQKTAPFLFLQQLIQMSTDFYNSWHSYSLINKQYEVCTAHRA